MHNSGTKHRKVKEIAGNPNIPCMYLNNLEQMYVFQVFLQCPEWWIVLLRDALNCLLLLGNTVLLFSGTKMYTLTPMGSNSKKAYWFKKEQNQPLSLTSLRKDGGQDFLEHNVVLWKIGWMNGLKCSTNCSVCILAWDTTALRPQGRREKLCEILL